MFYAYRVYIVDLNRTRNRNRMLELRDFVETNERQIADLISSKLLEDYDEGDGM